MLGLLASPFGKIGMAAAAVVVAFGLGQWTGRSAATSNAKIEAAENTARILKKRGQIDEEVSTGDAVALCADFGLPDDQQAECVRRLLQANANSGNVDLHGDE